MYIVFTYIYTDIDICINLYICMYIHIYFMVYIVYYGVYIYTKYRSKLLFFLRVYFGCGHFVHSGRENLASRLDVLKGNEGIADYCHVEMATILNIYDCDDTPDTF